MGPLSTSKSWRRVEAKGVSEGGLHGRRSLMGSNSEEIRLSLKPFGGKEVVSEILRRRKWQSLGRIQTRKRAWGSLAGPGAGS